MRSRIGLAARRYRNIRMADAIPDRVFASEHIHETGQHRVLVVFERLIVGALDFHADREIIAAPAAVPLGLPRMPRTTSAGHELHQLAVATDKEMTGDLRVGDLSIIRMSERIEVIGKQVDDAGTAKFTGRKTDVVNDQQVDP